MTNQYVTQAYSDSKFNRYKQLILDYIQLNDSSDFILLFSHDLSRSGAPVLLLKLAKTLFERHNKRIILITLQDGELYSEFNQYCCVINLEQISIAQLEDYNLVQQLFCLFFDYSINSAILNTMGGGLFISVLEKYQFKYIILVHEMWNLIKAIGWGNSVLPLIPFMSTHNKFIFSSEYTYNNLINNSGVEIRKNIWPQGYSFINKHLNRVKARFDLRNVLSIPYNAKIILGAGKDFYRKGVDIFYEMSTKLALDNPNYYFVWLGSRDEPEIRNLIEINKVRQIMFIDFLQDESLFFAGADIFVLTSREDPLPNVVLNAMSCGVPVIAFRDCGGAPEVLAKVDSELLIANKLDMDDLAHKLKHLLSDASQSDYRKIEIKSRELLNQEYDFGLYVEKLMHALNYKVSVIIPNYNYGKYLAKRLVSIIYQTIKPYEIIFLDDCSSGDDVELAESILKTSDIHYQIIKNENNEGVYAQWVKGVNLASGDLIWIAEADDFSDSCFLEKLVDRFHNKDINLAYSQSRLVGPDGQIIADNVLSHTNALSETKWQQNYCEEGDVALITDFLYRNVIVNVSAVLFRKTALTKEILTQLLNYKYCGDWYLYVRLLLNGGKVYYESEILNSFRRHNVSVTLTKNKCPAYLQELVAIKKVILSNYTIAEYELAKAINYLETDYGFTKDIVANNVRDLYNYSKRSKVLFVSTNPSATEGGGSEVLWIEAAQLMQANGYEVAVALHHSGLLEHRVSELKNKFIKVFYKDTSNYSCLVDFRPDLVVFSQGDHNEGVDWFDQCRAHNIKYVIVNQLTKEGFWPDDRHGSLVRRSYVDAEKVFFTCEQNRLLMERQLGVNLHNAARHYNPTTISRNIELTYPKVIDDVYHLAYPARYVVIHKGQDILFEVLRQSKWKKRSLIVNLFGDGPNKQQLEQLKIYYDLENVIFKPYQKDIINIWRQNHGVVIPTRMEGVPIVLIGALLCGRMPILTDVGGHKEIIQDNISGFVAKAPTAELLDEALERAWQKRNDWQNIGQSARTAILKFMPEDPVADFVQKLKNV
ncbi:MAG: hypothetical protein K0R14_1369 [Burkholderiales bacterium]|jgi:glycosyltransferase involved in cell wall biosynthesis|nr:hypothetical protein [Burkholderiales bacterium]